MNYYPHHIGDFNNATRHLTRIERSIYRDMLDLYYDTELPLSLDIKGLCRKLLARTEEESTAVEQVLNEFFTETAQGWHHSRCECEIAEYRASISAKSAAGKASAAKRVQERLHRLAELNSSATPVQQPLSSVGSSVQLTSNQEPVTNNQEPVKAKAAALATRLPADWKPSIEEFAFCESERPELDPQSVANQFRDYWIAQPGAKSRKVDWSATWRNWVRNQRAQPARASPAGYESAKDRSRREASEQLTGRKQHEQRHQFTDIN